MENRDISTTFLKGIQVLQSFGDGAPAVTMAEIARRTGFDRATVRRLCLTLVQAGFLRQSGRSFMLTPRVLALSGAFLRANDFGRSVQPILNALARDLAGDAGLATLEDDRALYVAQSATVGARVSLGLTVGSSLPLATTAVGRVLLAGLDQADLDDTLARLETGDTPPDEIARQVHRVARDGFAVARGDYEPGICGIAVPVGDPGRPRAALGTSISMGDDGLDDRCRAAVSALQIAAANLRRLSALDSWPVVGAPDAD